MDEKFIQVLSLLRKTISENQFYVWLLVLTLALSIFSYLHRDFFDPQEELGPLRGDVLTWEKIPPGKLLKSIEQDGPLSHLFGITFLVGLMVFLSGLYLSVGFFRDLFKGKISLFSENFVRVDWKVSDTLRIVIVILFFIKFLYVTEPLFFRIFNSIFNLFVRFIVRSFLVDVFALGVVLYFVIKKYASKFSSLGLKFENFSHNLFIGGAHYIGLVPVLFTTILFSLFWTRLFGYEPQPSPIFNIFFQPQPRFLLFFLSFFVTLFGPVVEEIFFRGFCYPALRKKMSPLKAAVLISFVFALLHMNMLGFLPIFILGLLLVYLYEKTNSLISSITVHVIHNSLILYLVFLYRSLLLF